MDSGGLFFRRFELAEFAGQIGRGVSFPVSFKLQLRPNDTVLADHEGAGVGQTVLTIFHEHFVGGNDLAVRIGQEREFNLGAVGKLFQDLDRVIADSDDLRTGLPDCLEFFLQFN